MQYFKKLIEEHAEIGVSDLHLTGGHPVVYRKSGKLNFRQDMVFKHEYLDKLTEQLLTGRQLKLLREQLSCDLAISIAGVRLRINVFTAQRGLSYAIRFLPGRVPTLDLLNLHPSLKELTSRHSGLILLCGSTGSGKTTTIAALINEINLTRSEHIITLEDPIEYKFVPEKSFFQQRELGLHFHSFAQGIKDILREDPNVILVGELREPEVIRLTLDAAESGHLVIATLHASSPEEALYRLCNSFPSGSQDVVRQQLASCLAGIIVQQLHLIEDKGFLIPNLAILRQNSAVKAVIRENKLSQLESIIQMGRAENMFSMEDYKRDFIDKLDNPLNPKLNFREENQKPPEPEYFSPLIDEEMSALQAKRAIDLA